MPRINGDKIIYNSNHDLIVHNDWIRMLDTFKKNFFNPISVLYPSCDFDVTPSKVFSNVTYVDINKEAIDFLSSSGFKAFNCDVNDFMSEKYFDLLILLNPCISSFKATKHLKPDGFVIANNYHGNAKELFDDDNYSLLGIIKQRDSSLVTDFTDLFIPYSSISELKSINPDYYDFKLDCYKNVFNVINKDVSKLSDDKIIELGLSYFFEGLPYKRGYCDDFYVFKKEC